MKGWCRDFLLAIPLLASAALVSGQTPRGSVTLTGEYRNSWALLIGVDHTPGKATLSSVADAQRMQAALVKIGFPKKNIRVLADPKGADIRRTILQPFPAMGANDRYVVYFSGHGDTQRLPDGDTEGYLLAADYSSRDPLNTAIAMKEIRDFGRRMPVKHVLFILDACNAGHAVEQTGGDVPTAPEALKPYLEKRVTEILAAGRADQNAYQINNQGIFTKAVIEALEFFPAKRSGAALTTTLLWNDVMREVSAKSEGALTPPQPYRSGQGAFVLWFPSPGATPAEPRILREYGGVAIRGKVPGIEVWLDGQRIGETQSGRVLVRDNVSAGRHRIKAAKPGNKDWVQEIEVPANQRVEVTLDVEPLRTEPHKTAGNDTGEMALIPAGEFWMGSTRDEVDRAIAECRKHRSNPIPTAEAQCKDRFERELPRHRLVLDAFYIDRYEVTNTRFERFVRATGHKTTAEQEGRGRGWQQKDGKWQFVTVNGVSWRAPNVAATSAPSDHPVVQVSWHDAEAYCKWAGNRLPTEAEWEKAARGSDGRRYPWGEDWDTTRANGDMSVKATRPVGSYPNGTSPYGVHDMAGNVLEWVTDWFAPDYYLRSSDRNPKGPDGGTYRVLRGGPWSSGPLYLRTANRLHGRPATPNNNIGFRCARGAS